MSVNDDWDVEQHKVEYESDEHWELRRKFLLAHKDKFPEDVLVCLAQVFVNVELLGCRYPQETMDLIKELSQDVAAEYREKQKKKLQRTFVEASQAASSKVKGCAAKISTITEKSKSNMPNCISNNNIGQSHIEHHFKNNTNFNPTNTLLPNVTKESDTSRTSNAINYDQQSYRNLENIEERLPKRLKTEEDDASKSQDLYSDIILWERPGDNANSILEASATMCGMTLQWNYTKVEEGWECSLNILRIQQLSCSTNANKKVARKEAATIALEKLQKHCYTVKVKQDIDAQSNVIVTTEEIKSRNSSSDDDWKVSSCIGKKLMTMMGWAGGGLGKSEQGIVEPVSTMVKAQINREGLGLKTNSSSAVHEIKTKCRKLFKDLLQTESYLGNNIAFLDFSKEDRILIHQIAQAMGLKTRSYGKDQRRLIVSRKVNIRSLVKELSNLGGVSENYELIKPTDEKLSLPLTSIDM